MLKKMPQKAETIESREVAKQTNETHSHVMRKIDSLIGYIKPEPKLVSANYFIESTYKDKNNQTRPCYLLTRLGCEMYVNKLSGKKGTLFTAFYVQKFHEMDEQIKLQNQDSYMIEDPVKRAEKWIAEQNERKQLSIENQKLKPKALIVDAMETSKGVILVRQMAKIISNHVCKIGEKQLFRWLRDNGYLIKRHGSDYNMPTQKSIKLGIFQVKSNHILHNSGDMQTTFTTKVTGKGQKYLLSKFIDMYNFDVSNQLPTNLED